jgi:hypothetical protein
MGSGELLMRTACQVVWSGGGINRAPEPILEVLRLELTALPD